MDEFHNSVPSEEPNTKITYCMILNICSSKGKKKNYNACRQIQGISGVMDGCNKEVRNFMMKKRFYCGYTTVNNYTHSKFT